MQKRFTFRASDSRPGSNVDKYQPRHARQIRKRRAAKREPANLAEIVMAAATVCAVLSAWIQPVVAPAQPVVPARCEIVEVQFPRP